MRFVSLKRYLHAEEEPEYLRIIGLLMQAMALHAVPGETGDYDVFRRDLDRIETEMSQAKGPGELLVSAGASIQALQDYNGRTARFYRRQGVELQNMIAMLARTVIQIGTGSERSLQRLKVIEEQMETAGKMEDVQRVKEELRECLDHVREETALRKSESEAVVAGMRGGIEALRQRLSPDSFGHEEDPATGLQGQQAAERAFHDALSTPGPKFVVAAVVSRIQSINARFGYALGDQVIHAFKEHLAANLAGDRLFRWRGPALVALVDRAGPLERVRAEMKRVFDKRIEGTFDAGGRSVLIPVSAEWSVFALTEAVEARKQIETFVVNQAPGA